MGNEKHENERDKNIHACTGLSEAISSLLGPKSMEKLLVEWDGNLIVTNDGATALKAMNVAHPAAQMLVDISKGMDEHIGDGTTSVVVLAGALLKEAGYLIHNEHIHPSRIIRGYMSAAKIAESYTQSLGVSVDLSREEEAKNYLMKVAHTSLESKFVSHAAPVLISHAVEAALMTQGNINNVYVIRVAGGRLKDAIKANGVAVECADHVSHNTKSWSSSDSKSELRLGVISYSFNKPEPSVSCTTVVPNPTQMDRLIREEERYVKKLAANVARAVDVAVVERSALGQTFPPLARHVLSRTKVVLLPDVSKDLVDRVVLATGARRITSPEHLGKGNKDNGIVPISKAEYMQIGKRKFVVIEPLCGRNNNAVTVFLRGASDVNLEEAERAFHDALCVVCKVLGSPVLVPGGGVIESSLSVHLNHLSETEPDFALAAAYRAFSSALMCIPSALASNAGMDGLSVAAELRCKHTIAREEGQKCTMGVRLDKMCVGDVMSADVLEPLKSKVSQFAMACEAACSILKIDDVIYTND